MSDPIVTQSNPVEPHKSLADALLAIQAEVPNLRLGKDAEGQIQNRKYKYLTLGKLMDEGSPLLNRHGLVWQTFPTTLDGKPALRYRLTHVPTAEHEEETMLLMLGADANSQGLGSAITYGRRQSFTCVLDIVADEDDDGKAASGDQRLMVSRKLDKREIERMEEQIAGAGLELADVLGTVDAATVEDLTMAQAHQIKGILKLKGKDDG